MKISESIKQAILTSGSSRYQIAKRARVHQSVISRFVRGKSQLTLATVDRICEALRLEITVRSQDDVDHE